MTLRERIPSILVGLGILWLAITTMYLKGTAGTPDAVTVLWTYGTGFLILIVGLYKLITLKREITSLDDDS